MIINVRPSPSTDWMILPCVTKHRVTFPERRSHRFVQEKFSSSVPHLGHSFSQQLRSAYSTNRPNEFLLYFPSVCCRKAESQTVNWYNQSVKLSALVPHYLQTASKEWMIVPCVKKYRVIFPEWKLHRLVQETFSSSVPHFGHSFSK